MLSNKYKQNRLNKFDSRHFHKLEFAILLAPEEIGTGTEGDPYGRPKNSNSNFEEIHEKHLWVHECL